MASEEQSTNTTTAPTPAPVTLPPYPEMIMSAIEALNDQNGSNKSAIWKQIESTYGDLPPVFSTLLTQNLNKMKQMGQLVLVKNNYMKPDPNAPPRRGRGRPPKPKPALPLGYIPPPPRPRGRPPKSHDPLAPPKIKTTTTTTTATSVSGRKRGRPPKSAKTTTGGGVAATASTGVRRGRGRPPKVKPAVAPPVGA